MSQRRTQLVGKGRQLRAGKVPFIPDRGDFSRLLRLLHGAGQVLGAATAVNGNPPHHLAERVGQVVGQIKLLAPVQLTGRVQRRAEIVVQGTHLGIGHNEFGHAQHRAQVGAAKQVFGAGLNL